MFALRGSALRRAPLWVKLSAPYRLWSGAGPANPASLARAFTDDGRQIGNPVLRWSSSNSAIAEKLRISANNTLPLRSSCEAKALLCAVLEGFERRTTN